MNERDLIGKILSQFTDSSDLLLKGIGDDCAVIAESGQLCWLVSTDVLVESVHFVREWHDPYNLGRKSVAVNFSDIAAMGGTPRFILISLVLPNKTPDEWLQKWHDGVKSMLGEFSSVLIGGDVARGAQLTINVTVIGTAHPESVVYRSGAEPDQDIYVTNNLGSSAAGFELLNRGINSRSKFLPLIKAHLDPQPQVKIGSMLAESRLISSMQDISDGIATDLSHICKASDVSAVLDGRKIPIDSLVQEMASEFNVSALDLALYGGEDYQLVFTSDTENRSKIQDITMSTGVPITRVGNTHRGPAKVTLGGDGHQKDITFKGFEHI